MRASGAALEGEWCSNRLRVAQHKRESGAALEGEWCSTRGRVVQH